MATGICPWCGKKVDKFIMFRGDVVGCRYCGIHTKQTNADRIRAMPDADLAEFLQDVAMQGGIELGGRPTTWLDWLRQEANDVGQ